MDNVIDLIDNLPAQLGKHSLDMLKYICQTAFSKAEDCKLETAIMNMASLGAISERLKVDAARAWDDGLITHEEMDGAKDKLMELREDIMPSMITATLARLCNCRVR